MEIIQIIATAGALSVVALIIGLWIQSKVKAPTTTQLPHSAAITKDVLDQILGQATKVVDNPTTPDTVAKPKKKRKYYPKKPKTQL